MLEEIALGRYADYGGRGDYRYSPEQRTAAATALALLRVAQEIANIEIFLQSWAEHQAGIVSEDDE
ncbi:MAG TPA: hypothetical protein VHM25_21340 [Polyangiaceae bacterium]|nr:hypothetical protein [Polyangiaceae bacterium]